MMPPDHPIHETLRLLDKLDAAIASLPDRRAVPIQPATQPKTEMTRP